MAQYDGIKNQRLQLHTILGSDSPGTVTMSDGTVYGPVVPSVLSYAPGIPLQPAPTLNGSPAEIWAVLPKHGVAFLAAYPLFTVSGLSLDSNGNPLDPFCNALSRPSNGGVAYNMSTGRMLLQTVQGWVDWSTGVPA